MNWGVSQPPDHVERAVRRVLGDEIDRFERIDRGFTAAERWRAVRHDGASAFAKGATNSETGSWLRTEALVYQQVDGGFLPNLLGFVDDGAHPVLVLEDLTDATWPPPWSAPQVAQVQSTLRELGAQAAPSELPDAETLRPAFSGWSKVEADPEPFLSLGLCSRKYLIRALPMLVSAERAVRLSGDELLHFDVRSDNLCFREGRCLLVDWNWACRGNATLDLACWLPSLRAEGGPPPEELLPDAPNAAAAVSGFFASQAGLPPGPLSAAVRELQRTQLVEAFPWALRALRLPPADPPEDDDA